MTSVHGLQNRSGTFYSRHRLPNDIALLLSKKEVVKSLRTTVWCQAIHRHIHLTTRLKQVISSMRDLKLEDRLQAEALFKIWFDRRLETDFHGRLTFGREAWPNMRTAKMRAATGENVPNEILTYAHLVADLICKQTHASLDKPHLIKLLAHGLYELDRNVYPKRDHGDFSDEVNDGLIRRVLDSNGVGSVVAGPVVLPQSTALSKLIEHFLSENQSAWQTKTFHDYRQTLGLALEFWGADMTIEPITKQLARDLKGLLLKLPANMKQRFPGLSAVEAIAQAEKRGLPRLAPKTLNKRLSNLSSFFRWAVDQGYIEVNPFTNLTVKETVSARTKRDPFTSSQLKIVFSSGIYGKGPAGLASGATLRDLEDYWVPLIALFTGMRLGEIVQLTVVDIQQTREGHWVFDIHERGGNRLKTSASSRRTPIHQTLLDLGLVEYKNHLEGRGYDRLFPDLRVASDGYGSSAFSKRFNRFLRRTGVKVDRKLTFHSFRHTMKDLMREAGIHEAVQHAIIGHDDKSVAAGYGSGYTTQSLHRELHKIETGIDLSHLIPTRKQDLNSVRRKQPC